jgi:8-oxo-dGTP pyrophosphatase MutT (NUDIX family)
MDFDFFERRISKIKNLPLPGQASHYKMAPKDRIEELSTMDISKRSPRKAAVMALFYPNQNRETHLLCILRKTYKGVHSNQVGFPGGKVEHTDTDLVHTALRETEEEVGVAPTDITLVRQLSQIYIPPSNFEVSPFLGLYKRPKPFVKQDSEVEMLLEIPVRDFLSDVNLVQKKLATSYAEDMEVPAFKLNGYIIWGATAMMMNEIKVMLNQVM